MQLQKQLTDTQQNMLSAMQLHVDNAYKLEQQGFISRGQRMQFEVARNQVQRLYQSTQNQHQNSIYELAVLLGLPHIEPLKHTAVYQHPASPQLASITQRLPKYTIKSKAKNRHFACR